MSIPEPNKKPADAAFFCVYVQAACFFSKLNSIKNQVSIKIAANYITGGIELNNYR